MRIFKNVINVIIREIREVHFTTSHIRIHSWAKLRETRDRNPRRATTTLACPGWIYARPRDKDDSDNTVLLPAGVPPSFLIPHGTADFVRSYRRWWFQVSPLKRRHNGIPALAAESAQVVPSRQRTHGICPCKAAGVIESTLMSGGDASHRFLPLLFFQVINHRFQNPDMGTACNAGHRTRPWFYK